MEQHPIPRQITTFEFKLIGFLTLRQFLYLVISLPVAYILFKIIPIPLLNIMAAGICAAFGAALAFLPINDRPMEVWIRNFIKRLSSPTQYTYMKHNSPLYFLRNLYFVSDPHRVLAHVESQEKLAAYLATTQQAATQAAITQRQRVQGLLRNKPIAQITPPQSSAASAAAPVQAPSTIPLVQHAAFSGIVKNNKQIPLPGILIYVKDEHNTLLRLLKTNQHGVFASFNPIASGSYVFEMKDTNGMYFFDTMNINLSPETSGRPIEIVSKEML